VKLLVGSDDPIVRKGFCEIVRARAGWAVVSEAGTVAELIAHTRNGGAADVIVVDLPLGAHAGTEAISSIREAAPATPLLVLAPYAEEHYAPAFLRAGANGFVRRNAEPEEILTAISTIARGRNYRNTPIDRLRQTHELLSGRELEVFRYLAAGRKPTDIAAVMNLSIKTVSTYRARILEKTGFRSNADIVGYAIRTGMLS